MDRREFEDEFFLDEEQEKQQKRPSQPSRRSQDQQKELSQQRDGQQVRSSAKRTDWENASSFDSFSFDDDTLNETDQLRHASGSRPVRSANDRDRQYDSYEDLHDEPYTDRQGRHAARRHDDYDDYDDYDDDDGYDPDPEEEARLRLEKKEARRRRGKIAAGVFSWVKDLAIALLIVWFVLNFVAQNNKVIGTSMQPTVYANDVVLVNKFIYRFTDPERGDIIVFPTEEDGETVNLIKRIIGLPGDEIDIQDGKLYINGEVYEEDYISVETTAIDGQVTFPLTVPEGEYFVLGDNRTVSKDSRYLSVGTIAGSDIIGKVSLRIWPLDSIGFIR